MSLWRAKANCLNTTAWLYYRRYFIIQYRVQPIQWIDMNSTWIRHLHHLNDPKVLRDVCMPWRSHQCCVNYRSTRMQNWILIIHAWSGEIHSFCVWKRDEWWNLMVSEDEEEEYWPGSLKKFHVRWLGRRRLFWWHIQVQCTVKDAHKDGRNSLKIVEEAKSFTTEWWSRFLWHT